MTQTRRGLIAIAIGAFATTLAACSGNAVDFNSQGGSSGQNGGQSNQAAGGYTPGGYTGNGGNLIHEAGGSTFIASGGTSSGGTSSGGSESFSGGKFGVIPGPGDGVFDCAHAPDLCIAAPDGHIVPYADEAELSSKIVGAWLRCFGTGFPQRGAGILISADHTWNSLEEGSDGSCKRVDTGFDDYGTWTAESTGDHVQFNLLKAGGGGAYYFPMFSDTGRLRLDPGGLPTEYVKAPNF